MISLTIQDAQDSMTLSSVLEIPIALTDQITETDVQTMDGNISTYFGSAKRQYAFEIAWMSAEDYAKLKGFRDRQYQNLKYPQITVDGAMNLNVTGMTAKMTLNEQKVIDSCGTVEDVILNFRESKQLP